MSVAYNDVLTDDSDNFYRLASDFESDDGENYEDQDDDDDEYEGKGVKDQYEKKR